jgi:hypothetical protein
MVAGKTPVKAMRPKSASASASIAGGRMLYVQT